MFLIASAGAPAFLAEIVVLIVAGAAIGYVCQRFGIVPIVGFLLAGVVIGPNALGLVGNRELVDAAAEVGVILLLFAIGIEFSLERLSQIRRLIFAGGGLQVGLATALTMVLLLAVGVDWRMALFSGLLVALSSTAIVLKLLGDRGEMTTEPGRVALGLLIFQDLAIVLMVLLVPMISGTGVEMGEMAWALAKAGLIIAAVLVFARRLMPPLLELVARTCSPEIFLLTIIAICFGTAWVTSIAGVSVSLGAFLAGLIVSESHFSEHALSEILPLKILFSATFFVSVGMLLDVAFVVDNLLLVGGAVAAVLAIKVVTTGVAARVLGYSMATATASALMLAQVGEFSFVLERAGRELGLFPMGLGEDGSQAFIAATVILMVATPVLSAAGRRLAAMLTARSAKQQAHALMHDEFEPEATTLENHVVVAGYGDAARSLVHVLHGSGVPYIITTLSPAGANEAEDEGLPVMRGDATRRRTLELAGVERAKMLVVPDDDPATAGRIVSIGRILNPTMRIVVRTRYTAGALRLSEEGADAVIAEEQESIVAMFADVLHAYRIEPEQIERFETLLRNEGYDALRGQKLPAEPVAVCDGLNDHCFDTREIRIRAHTRADGMRIGEFEFEPAGIALKRIDRDGASIEFDSGTVVQPGDALTVVGDAEAFVQMAKFFRLPDGDVDTTAEIIANQQKPGNTMIDTEQTVTVQIRNNGCEHVQQIGPVRPGTRGCEECLQTGDTWVHLRVCMTCGHVGCCDSSKNKHASRHYHHTDHPIVRSLEPGEKWGWCYVDQKIV